MLSSLEGYIKRRNKIHQGALRSFRSDSPHPQEEVGLASVLFYFMFCSFLKKKFSDFEIHVGIRGPFLTSPLAPGENFTPWE
jgi:hypothetical protein